MDLSTCPDREELLAYAAGKLDDMASEALADHLDACEACQALLVTLDGIPDTLVDRLRRAPKQDQYEREPALLRAVTQAKAVFATCGAATVAAPSPPPPAADLGQLGEYQLLAKLGEGGMGAVYKARQARLKRIVALKVLPKERTADPSAVARFEREMEAVGRLNHPNIVQAYDARDCDGTTVLVMEYVEGMDLGQVVLHLRGLAIADACEVVRQTALGLQSAHENGLVHRDIKPSNIMLTQRGQVKILDMGLALLGAEQPGSGELTSAGSAMGTADYMAPEQVSDAHSVDIRADVYSLGGTLYKLLSGRAPFSGPKYKSHGEKLVGHLRDTPAPIRLLRTDVSAELAAVIERMMAKNPAERFATPADVAAAMTPFAAGCDLARMSAEADAMAKGAVEAEKSQAATEPFLPSSSTGTHPSSPEVEIIEHPATIPLSAFAQSPRAAPRALSAARRALKRPAVAVALAVIVAAVLLGIVVRIKDRSGKETVITLPEGSEVTIEERAEGDHASPRPQAGEGPGVRAVGSLIGPDGNWKLPPGAPQPTIAPFDADQARKHQEAWAEYLGTPVEMTNAIGMKLVLIPPGEFTMGEGGDTHKVRITKPFYLGKYEVTQEEWEAVMGKGYNPSSFSGPTNPVDMVSWGDCQFFLKKLTEKCGVAEGSYRMPTEAQWEYACRGGSTSLYFYGDAEMELDDYGWCIRNSDKKTHAVGQKKPNGWRLYDIYGNVREWCSDWFDKDYPKASARTDPTGPSSGSLRMHRGGAWNGPAYACRSAYRYGDGPGFRLTNTGLRVALVLADKWPVGHALPESKARQAKADLPPPEPSLQEVLSSAKTEPPVRPKPGEPLTTSALVANPAPIAGVRSWSLETVGPRGRIEALAYSPDGRLLAALSSDGLIRIWDPATRELRQVLSATDSPLGVSSGSIAWSRDLGLLAASPATRLHVWDLSSSLAKHALVPSAVQGSNPRPVAGSADGALLASTSGRYVFVWSLDPPRAIKAIEHGQRDPLVALSPDGRTLATGDGDTPVAKIGPSIKLWDVGSGALKRTFPLGRGCVKDLAWSPDGVVLAAACGHPSKGVFLWDTRAGEPWGPPGAYQWPGCTSLAWSPDGKTLAGGSATCNSPPLSTGEVQLWDVSGHVVRKTHTLPGGVPTGSLAYSLDGSQLAVGTVKGGIWLFDSHLTTGKELLPRHSTLSFTIAFSPDGKYLAFAGPSGKVGLWQLDSSNAPRLLEGSATWPPKADWPYEPGYSRVAWSADTKALAFEGGGQTRVWAVGSGKQMGTVEKTGRLGGLSPDGQVLLGLAPYGGTPRFWDVASRSPMHYAEGTGGYGRWSPEGSKIAVISADKVEICDARDGKLLKTLPWHCEVSSHPVAWRPDGKALSIAVGGVLWTADEAE